MPKALGKLENRLAQKLPAPVTRFYENYHVTIKQLILGAMIAAIAVIGLEAKHAGDEADKANKEVRVIQQHSPCTPIAGPGSRPVHPEQCAENYAVGFKTLTPLQSCEFLQKGAGLISIGNRPIPPVTCRVPDSVKKERKSGQVTHEGAKVGSADQSAPSRGVPASGDGVGGSDTASAGSPTPASSSPGGSEPSVPGKHHGKEPSHEAEQPSGGHEGSSGGSTPESSSGAPPASSPEASTPESGPVAEAPPTGGGSSPGGGGTTAGSKTGLETVVGGLKEVVGGVGHVGEEATEPVTKPLCEDGVLGVKVCLR